MGGSLVSVSSRGEEVITRVVAEKGLTSKA